MIGLVMLLLLLTPFPEFLLEPEMLTAQEGVPALAGSTAQAHL